MMLVVGKCTTSKLIDENYNPASKRSEGAGRTAFSGSHQKRTSTFVGFGKDDDAAKIPLAKKKVLELRIFHDENNKMNLSVKDIGGSLLLVPQFTLYADCRRGRRPDFTAAAPPVLAENLFNQFTESIKETGINVQTGVFGAHMEVALVNDGPVTIFMEF